MTNMKRALCLMLCALLTLLACAGCTQEMGLTEKAQDVLAKLTTGSFEALTEQFDENMLAVVDAAALESAWGSVTGQLGPVTGIAAAQEDEASRTAALLMQHENGSALLVVVYDEAGRIAGLSINPQAAAVQTVARDLPQGASAQRVALFEGSERELAGEILLPAGADANTPFVVFAHGSGPSDMDETVGGVKPLRDLAYDLAALGVGSLRFDKITYAHPEWPVETVDQEYLEPVAEALAVLKAQTGAQRVYLVGHSEGGMLAPYLVQQCGFDGAVALAGTPWQLWEISHAQNLAVLETLPQEQRHEVLYMQVEAEREKAMRLTEMSDEEAAGTAVFGVSAIYQRHMAMMDQAQIAKESGKPFLFLWGEKDVQVSREAYEAWQERLGQDARFAYKTYPGLNHLFVTAEAGETIANVQQAYQAPKTVDAQVAQDIAAWLAQ